MEHEYDGMKFETKPSDGSCLGCYFEQNPGCSTTPSCKYMIWVKKEDLVKATENITFSPDQSSQKITFSSEQIKYLQEVFQIDAAQEVLPVKDGFVKKGDTIWWKCEDGPEEVLVEKDWDNIKEFPQYYSIKEPKYKIVYED